MKTTEESSLQVLKEVLPILESWEDYTNDALYGRLLEFIKEKGYKKWLCDVADPDSPFR